MKLFSSNMLFGRVFISSNIKLQWFQLMCQNVQSNVIGYLLYAFKMISLH